MEELTPSDTPAPDPRVDAAVVEFLRAQDRKECLDPEPWIASKPEEIRSSIRQILVMLGLMSSSPPQPRTNRVITPTLPDWGRYTALTLVGSGGMGAVYRATDTILGRVVALKVMHNDLASEPATAARFLDEARVASQLQHPNIVPVYDYGSMPGEVDRPFFTMRLVAQRTLVDSAAEYHQNPTDTGREELLRQFIAICGAVAYAHNKGVVHRDLKPSNIMVGAFGEVQVMDWGLSKLLDSEETESALLGETVQVSGTVESVAGTIRGTLAYMPPEQARGEAVGPRADVFALGAVLCHILTGRPVYDAADKAERLRMASECATEPTFERLTATRSPTELIALIRKCLARELSERPDSAEQVGACVGEYLAAAEQRALDAEVSRSRAEERVSGERKKRRWQLAAAGIGLTLVFSAVAASIWYDFDREARRLEDDAKAREAEREELSRREKEAREREEREREDRRQTTTRAADIATATAEMYTAIERDQLGVAGAALQRAKGRLGLDPPTNLGATVVEAEKNYGAVVALDEIRQERGVLKVDPKLPTTPVIEKYAKLFGSLGCSPASDGCAERIKTSPIRSALVRALDDWATAQVQFIYNSHGRVSYVSLSGDVSQFKAILAVARAVDPQSGWGEALRDPEARLNEKRMAEIANEIDPTQLTVPQIEALVEALPHTSPIAAKLIRSAEFRFPNDFWVNYTLAKHHAATYTGDFASDRPLRREAIGYARTALALRPDSLGVLVLLAELYESENLVDDLHVIVNRIELLGRESWMSSYIRAVAARKTQHYREAIGYLQKAISQGGERNRLRSELAAMHVALGEFDSAQNVVEDILREHPADEGATVLKVVTLFLRGRTAEAERICLQFLNNRPESEETRALLAVMLLNRGRVADAANILNKLRPNIHDNTLVAGAIAMIDLIRGENAAAVHRLERNIRLTPWYQSYIILMFASARAGNFQIALEAMTAARQALRNNTANQSQLLGLGQFMWFQYETNLKEFLKPEQKLAGRAPSIPTEKLEELVRGFPLTMLCINWGDYFFAKECYLSAAKLYERGIPPDSMHGPNSYTVMLFSNRVNGMCAAAQASIGAGHDGLHGTDADRAKCRRLAIRFLKEEVTRHQQIVEAEDRNTKSSNIQLHLLRMHRLLDPIRNPVVIQTMSIEDQKVLTELWAEVDKLLEKLNPPLGLSWEPKPLAPAPRPATNSR